MNPTNKAAMQKWVCSLPSKELGDLLHFAFQEKAKRKKAKKKSEKSKLARKTYFILSFVVFKDRNYII